MRCAQLNDADLERDAGGTQGLDRAVQPLIPRFPPQQAAAQSHVRALTGVRSGQRAVRVELDQYLL